MSGAKDKGKVAKPAPESLHLSATYKRGDDVKTEFRMAVGAVEARAAKVFAEGRMLRVSIYVEEIDDRTTRR